MKNRKPIARSTSPIQRNTPPKNRGGKRFPKGYDKAYRAWIRTLPCLLRGNPKHVCGDAQPAHVHADATGAGDRGQLIPLCAGAHTMGHKNFHSTGRHSFPAYWGLGTFDDLVAVAAQLDVQYQESQ